MTDTVTIRPDAGSATSISISCCDRGHVFVRLHDKKGDVFAFGAIDRSCCSVLIDRMFDALDGVGAGKCDGHT